MKCEILSATRDASRWDDVFESLPPSYRDVHFTSAYACIAQKLGGEALAFVQNDIFKPFSKRAVAGRNDAFEAVSFYQYGGEINASFDEWARSASIVREYCCTHPYLLPQGRETKQVVVIDLANFSRATVSRRIRRALDDEIVWQMRDDAADRFWRLYDSAMQRKSATARWTRSLDYFRAYGEHVGARWFFAESIDAERGLLTIGIGQIAYAHYLGGDRASSGVDATLYYNAALVLRDLGFRFFHLGGGLSDSPNDMLLFFKSGFSDLRWTIYRQLRVLDEAKAA